MKLLNNTLSGFELIKQLEKNTEVRSTHEMGSRFHIIIWCQ